MFNRDKLKALADQAKAAGGRLATSAQAGIAQAQQNFAAQRAASPGSDLAAEDAIRLLTAQNEALRMRLKAQKRLSEENEHLRAALEQLQGRDEGAAAPGPAADRAELESQVEMLVAAHADARAEAVAARAAARGAAAERAAALRSAEELRGERCSLRELQAATAEAAAQAAALERENTGLQATLGAERVERRQLELAQAQVEALQARLGEAEAARAALAATQDLHGRGQGLRVAAGVGGAPDATGLGTAHAELAQTRAELAGAQAEVARAQAEPAHAHAELQGERPRGSSAAEQPVDLQTLEAAPHAGPQPDAGLPAASVQGSRQDSAGSASPGPASRDLEELRGLLSGAGGLAGDPGTGAVQRSVSVPVGMGAVREGWDRVPGASTGGAAGSHGSGGLAQALLERMAASIRATEGSFAGLSDELVEAHTKNERLAQELAALSQRVEHDRTAVEEKTAGAEARAGELGAEGDARPSIQTAEGDALRARAGGAEARLGVAEGASADARRGLDAAEQARSALEAELRAAREDRDAAVSGWVSLRATAAADLEHAQQEASAKLAHARQEAAAELAVARQDAAAELADARQEAAIVLDRLGRETEAEVERVKSEAAAGLEHERVRTTAELAAAGERAAQALAAARAEAAAGLAAAQQAAVLQLASVREEAGVQQREAEAAAAAACQALESQLERVRGEQQRLEASLVAEREASRDAVRARDEAATAATARHEELAHAAEERAVAEVEAATAARCQAELEGRLRAAQDRAAEAGARDRAELARQAEALGAASLRASAAEARCLSLQATIEALRAQTAALQEEVAALEAGAGAASLLRSPGAGGPVAASGQEQAYRAAELDPGARGHGSEAGSPRAGPEWAGPGSGDPAIPRILAAGERPADQQTAGNAELQGRIRDLELALLESEHTHALRDTSASILKEEIEEMRRRDNRESVSLEYLKNVVLSGFNTGQLPPTSPLVPVLAKLLQFSPQESRQVAAKAAQASQAFRLLPGF